ncbi:O-antigen ligase family protein [Thalassobellus sediminis]|uniref:O-antigen ligase family protein n=1 Tax=Thalassobellus sediminis TaxID=3367753 RepID=UPI0037975B94
MDFSKSTWRYYNYSDLSNQSAGIPRFKGFLYEPSYYALMFSPLLLYYFYKFIFVEKSYKTFGNLLFVAIPIIFTWSFGVLLGILLAIIIFVIYYSIKYFKINIYFFIVFSLLPIGVILLLIFNTEISHRIVMNFKGDDLSTKGRTSNAFEIANYLIHGKSPFFGIGLGQIKVFGQEYIQNYYGYQKWFRVSIPNAFAETLAIFGYTGAFIRLFIQLFLFFYKKCYNNMFSFTLFAFIFIYQFTGSFITSTLEYIIWLMAFMNLFPEFNISKRYA